jgi:hypothetical protein
MPKDLPTLSAFSCVLLAIATRLPFSLCFIAGMTELTPILAVLRIPQFRVLDKRKIHYGNSI